MTPQRLDRFFLAIGAAIHVKSTSGMVRALFTLLKRALKIGDLIAIAAAIMIIIGVSALGASGRAKEARVRIDTAEGTFLYTLDVERVVQPLSETGTCRIAIDQVGVRVLSSDCPQRICVSMGTVRAAGQWIACMPHKVFVSIEGDYDVGAVDAATY